MDQLCTISLSTATWGKRAMGRLIIATILCAQSPGSQDIVWVPAGQSCPTYVSKTACETYSGGLCVSASRFDASIPMPCGAGPPELDGGGRANP